MTVTFAPIGVLPPPGEKDTWDRLTGVTERASVAAGGGGADGN